jgi:hypothetical protein
MPIAWFFAQLSADHFVRAWRTILRASFMDRHWQLFLLLHERHGSQFFHFFHILGYGIRVKKADGIGMLETIWVCPIKKVVYVMGESMFSNDSAYLPDHDLAFTLQIHI